jgi:hypothetical protein
LKGELRERSDPEAKRERLSPAHRLKKTEEMLFRIRTALDRGTKDELTWTKL